MLRDRCRAFFSEAILLRVDVQLVSVGDCSDAPWVWGPGNVGLYTFIAILAKHSRALTRGPQFILELLALINKLIQKKSFQLFS